MMRFLSLMTTIGLVLLLHNTINAFDTPDVFPISTRKALAEKAKQLNPTGYTTAGWSNRAATVLTPVHLDPVGVYTGDRPFYWNKIDVSCRMTIIELPTSKKGQKPNLWVHSPVGLDGPMKQALEELGTVQYVVTPNYEHVKFAYEWYISFPNANMWACPGLAERKPEIKWYAEIPNHYRPKGFQGGDGTSMPENTEIWDTDIIQPLHIDVEKNPFTGKSFFNEVVYYHKPTKTLMVTDLFWNYPQDTIPNSQYGADDTWELAPRVDKVPLGSRLWKFGMDNVYYPFYNNLMVTDKSAFRDIAEHIVNVWDVQTIIPAHGDLIRGKDFCQRVLKQHFQLN